MAKVSVTLERIDFEEIIEWLSGRMESYEFTANYLEGGDIPEGWLIEEVTDSREARKISNRYKRMVNEISSQIRESTGQ